MNVVYESLEEKPYLSVWRNNNDQSPDEEFEDYDTLKGLRRVSRKLLKNNPVALTLGVATVDMILGGQIFTEFYGVSKNKLKEVEKNIEDFHSAMDINKSATLDETLASTIFSVFENGDCLINIVANNKQFYVELIDSARIVTPREFETDPTVLNGVKFDKTGLIKGYYVTVDYDKETWKFVPCYNKHGMLTAYLTKSILTRRPEQTRAVPPLTVCSRILRHLNGYIEATVLGAKNSASITGVFSTSNPAGAMQSLRVDKASESTLTPIGQIAPNTIYFLNRGDHFDQMSPQKPPDNTVPFAKYLMLLSTASQRLSYNIAFMDLSDVTYSSWKGGNNQQERHFYRNGQEIAKINSWLSRMYLYWKGVNVDLTQLKTLTNLPRAKTIDAEKEARANRLNLEGGITSRRTASAENNKDIDIINQEVQQEKEFDVRLEAEMLALKKQLETEMGIVFPVEGKGSAMDREESLEKRKKDGNM